MNNVGGVRTKVFLKLLDYNPNELSQLKKRVDDLKNSSKHYYRVSKSTRNLRPANNTSEVIKTPNRKETQEITEKISTNDDLTESQKHNNEKNKTKSESKIKFMVRLLKNSQNFTPEADLASYLNIKFNEGYISLRTAFEYVDTDRLQHVLVEEFKVILEEFNVFLDNSTFNNLLRK